MRCDLFHRFTALFSQLLVSAACSLRQPGQLSTQPQEAGNARKTPVLWHFATSAQKNHPPARLHWPKQVEILQLGVYFIDFHPGARGEGKQHVHPSFYPSLPP